MNLSRFSTSVLSLSCIALASCASIKNAGSSSMTVVSNTTKATADTFSKIEMPKVSLASILPGPKVPVVEVREDELEALPTGHDRALAYEMEKKSNFWIFGGPIDFEEPELPEPGTEMDGSLLPPRIQSGSGQEL